MFARLALLFFLAALISAPINAQTTGPTTAASAVLWQAVNSAGGATAIASIADFIATGTITVFRTDTPVSGSATVRGKGVDQFRLDANLPTGTRSFAASKGAGAIIETDGTLTAIPFYDAAKLGSLTYPVAKILVALRDQLTVATYAGVATLDNGRQAIQIHVVRPFSPADDPKGLLTQLRTIDYFVDSQTGLVDETVDTMSDVASVGLTFVHEVDFENYVTVNGLAVPTLVREKMGGQTLWELQIASVRFDVGLVDADFVLQ
jgi:hypothetical protein